jgi:hypothetical protein
VVTTRLAGLALAAVVALTCGETPSAQDALVRTVWDAAGDGAMMSPDGRLVAFVDWNVSQVAVRDIATGSERQLPDPGSAGFPEPYFVFSPDSASLLFPFGNNRDAAPFRYEVRTIDLASGTHRVLALFSPDVASVAPLAWHAGAGILLNKVAADGSSELLMLNPMDGDVRVLQRRSAGDGQVWQAVFTRDGRGMVVLANDALSWIDAARGTSRPLDVTAQILLGWSADERTLLFHDARAGSVGNWSVGMSNGRTTDAPVLVHRTAPGVRWAGRTPDGVSYLEPAETPRLFHTAIDLAAGRVVSAPEPMLRVPHGIPGNPAWSRDGARLAFTVAPVNRNANRIFVADGVGAEPREIARVDMRVTGLDWSADGESLVIGGRASTRDSSFIGRIDVATGAIEQLVTGVPASAVAAGAGDRVVFVRAALAGTRATHAMDVRGAGAEPRILATYTIDDLPRSMSVSPDGQSIALLKSVPDSRASALLILPASGGEPRTVLQLQRPDGLELNQGRVPWTPDGRSVLVLIRRQGQRQLAAVRVDSGEITALPFAPEQGGRRSLALHPDGRQLMYVDGAGRDELKVMRDPRR